MQNCVKAIGASVKLLNEIRFTIWPSMLGIPIKAALALC